MPFDRSAGDSRAPLKRDLTPRERAVVELLTQRYSVRRIAVALGISERTVSNHIAAIGAAVPGDLPLTARIVAWARGATLDVLSGTTTGQLALL